MKLLDLTWRLKSDTATLIPWACSHADDAGFKEDLFIQCMEEIASTPDCKTIGLGDYQSFMRTTQRRYLRQYDPEDEAAWRELDHMVKASADEFAKRYLWKIKDKIIGLAEGNHFYRFSSGVTDTQYLCQVLGVPYLDKPAFIRMRMVDKHGKTAKVLRVLVHHGDWGSSASRAGGDVNSAQMKGLGFDFDIYLFAHSHLLWGMHVPQLSISTSGKLQEIEIPKAFIRVGSFMAGYAPQCSGNYVQKRLLNPTHLGYARLYIHLEPGHQNVKSRGRYKFEVRY